MKVVLNLVKMEYDVDAGSLGRRSSAVVVPPADPLIALATKVLTVQSEVGVAGLKVAELTKTAGQLTVADRTVVREVVEVHLRTSTITLTRVVRHHAVYHTRQLLTMRYCSVSM